MMVFFCGLAFPVEVLPQWAQTLSWAIPLTHGISVTRKALLLGTNLFDPAIVLGLEMLIIQTLILLPIGALLFKRLEKTARKTGALASY